MYIIYIYYIFLTDAIDSLDKVPCLVNGISWVQIPAVPVGAAQGLTIRGSTPILASHDQIFSGIYMKVWDMRCLVEPE